MTCSDIDCNVDSCKNDGDHIKTVHQIHVFINNMQILNNRYVVTLSSQIIYFMIAIYLKRTNATKNNYL